MSWQNQSGGGDKKNPWGNNDKGGSKRPSNGGGPNNPWGGGGDQPPNMDEMLRQAQKNLRQVMPGGFGFGKISFLFVIVLIGLWLASGFYILEPGVHGVVQQFGKAMPTKEVTGLRYNMPWPIENVTKVKVTQQREMKIGFSELTGRGGDRAKRDIPDESLMLTSDANIVDLDLVVQWDIKSASDYLFNIRDQENTIKKVAESAIREVVGQTNMFAIITKQRGAVADRAKVIMAKNLDDYHSGVRIKQVLIQQAEVHPDVQAAFQDVQSAKQDAEDVQNRAGAYREDILPKARGRAIQMTQQAQGYKESVIARASGDADRFNSVYKAYLTGKDVTKERMYLETMEEVLQGANKIILDQGEGGTGVLPYLPLNELRPASGQKR